MSAATYTSFFFLYFENEIFRNYLEQSNYFRDVLSFNDKEINGVKSYCPNEDKKICDKFLICGTAGSPILFNDQFLFEQYYTMYGGRYLHIASMVEYINGGVFIDILYTWVK